MSTARLGRPKRKRCCLNGCSNGWSNRIDSRCLEVNCCCNWRAATVQLRRAYTCRIAPQPVRFLSPQGTPHGLELGLIMIIGARHVQPRAGPGRASHSELSLSLSRTRLLRAQDFSASVSINLNHHGLWICRGRLGWDRATALVRRSARVVRARPGPGRLTQAGRLRLPGPPLAVPASLSLREVTCRLPLWPGHSGSCSVIKLAPVGASR